jgi:predicted Zn-dependent peptidase
VIDQIEAVTAEDIQKLAQTLFKTEQSSATILGPVDENADFESLIAF